MVQGHIFKLVTEDRFVAYEYAEGRVNDLSDISFDFIKELVYYLNSNSLEEVVGLQILGQAAGVKVEFDLGDYGTVMLNDEDARHGNPFVATGWVFTFEKGVIYFKGEETHAPTVKGSHKVLINGKLAPDIPALKGMLKQLGVINEVDCRTSRIVPENVIDHSIISRKPGFTLLARSELRVRLN